jgi:hypothetical protein
MFLKHCIKNINGNSDRLDANKSQLLCSSKAQPLDTCTIRQTFGNMWRPIGITREQFTERVKQRTLLKHMPVVEDTAMCFTIQCPMLLFQLLVIGPLIKTIGGLSKEIVNLSRTEVYQAVHSIIR